MGRIHLSGAAAALVVVGWSSDAQPLRDRLEGFTTAAHRGRPHHSDGNTIPGFEHAKADGVPIIETDIRLTKDGVPVVYHDEAIKRTTTGCSGRIDELTLEDIRACKVGGEFPLPTFEEMLQWAAGSIVINAEFKHPEVAEPAVALVRAYDAYEWVYFQTKSERSTYERARAADPRVALQFKPLSRADLDWALALDDPNLIVLELDQDLLTESIAAEVAASGRLSTANAWRLSRFEELAWDACDRLFGMGVNIAVTDQACGCVEAAAAWNAGEGTLLYARIEDTGVVLAGAGLLASAAFGVRRAVTRRRTTPDQEGTTA